MVFRGFSPDARRFFSEYEGCGDRSWFARNRSRYEYEVVGPAMALVEELGPRLAAMYPRVNYDTRRGGSGSVLRPSLDLGISRDGSPAKPSLGVMFWLGAGTKLERPLFYFCLGADRSFFYGGQHLFSPAALQRYRVAVAHWKSGPALVSILAGLEAADLRSMEEPAFERVPQPYWPHHPRAGLLMQAAIGVGRELEPSVVHSRGLLDACEGLAAAMRPLMDWLEPVAG